MIENRENFLKNWPVIWKKSLQIVDSWLKNLQKYRLLQNIRHFCDFIIYFPHFLPIFVKFLSNSRRFLTFFRPIFAHFSSLFRDFWSIFWKWSLKIIESWLKNWPKRVKKCAKSIKNHEITSRNELKITKGSRKNNDNLGKYLTNTIKTRRKLIRNRVKCWKMSRNWPLTTKTIVANHRK